MKQMIGTILTTVFVIWLTFSGAGRIELGEYVPAAELIIMGAIGAAGMLLIHRGEAEA